MHPKNFINAFTAFTKQSFFLQNMNLVSGIVSCNCDIPVCNWSNTTDM